MKKSIYLKIVTNNVINMLIRYALEAPLPLLTQRVIQAFTMAL